jgi:hypothetical protein
MSNQKDHVRNEIEKARIRLSILEELDLLDSEFGLIKIEYMQRRRILEMKLDDNAPAAAGGEPETVLKN